MLLVASVATLYPYLLPMPTSCCFRGDVILKSIRCRRDSLLVNEAIYLLSVDFMPLCPCPRASTSADTCGGRGLSACFHAFAVTRVGLVSVAVFRLHATCDQSRSFLYVMASNVLLLSTLMLCKRVGLSCPPESLA